MDTCSRSRFSSKAWIVISIGLATLLLAWPSFVNRGPFFIADTTGYIRSADAAFSTLLSYDSIWSDKRDLYKASAPSDDHSPKQEGSAKVPIHPPLIGRSIYYGAFIYPAVLLLGEHSGVLIQAGLSAIVVWLALALLGLKNRHSQIPAYFGAIGLLAFASSLPFTATILIPDYLTGLACVSLVILLCFWKAYSPWERMFLAAIIGLAALSHSSNLPLLLTLSLLGLIAKIRLPVSSAAIGIGLGAVALGFVGDALFVTAVAQKTGMTPIRPPFLTARLIADGPGHKLLRARCAVEKFEVCRYAARTPHDSDLFLWSEGADGVFSNADFASQGRLSEQDARFALATFRTYPLLTVASSSEALLRQLGMFELHLWRGSVSGRPLYNLDNLPQPVAARMQRTLSVRGAMPVGAPQKIIPLAAAISFPLAVWFLVLALRSADQRIRMLGVAIALVILAVVANAAITGGLSKPDARYNLRLIWLLPLFSYILSAALLPKMLGRRPVKRPAFESGLTPKAEQ